MVHMHLLHSYAKIAFEIIFKVAQCVQGGFIYKAINHLHFDSSCRTTDYVVPFRTGTNKILLLRMKLTNMDKVHGFETRQWIVQAY